MPVAQLKFQTGLRIQAEAGLPIVPVLATVATVGFAGAANSMICDRAVNVDVNVSL